MEKYVRVLKNAAHAMQGVEFLKFGFPVLAVVGTFLFLFFGLKGIFKQETIMLFAAREQLGSLGTPTSLFGTIHGKFAVITGILYILTGVVVGAILGGVSYYMWVGAASK